MTKVTDVIGPDVSSFQPNANFAAMVKVDGRVEFAGVKFTQGVRYVNPFCSAQWQRAGTAGLVRMAYHFADAHTPSSHGAEADHFTSALVAHASVKHGDMLVLDFEASWPMTNAARRHWRDRFLERVRHNLPGFSLGCYGGGWWASNGLGRPSNEDVWQWRAAYGNSVESLAPDWPISFWQFTDGRIGPSPHAIAGQAMDYSCFLGTRAQLRKLAGLDARPAPRRKKHAKGHKQLRWERQLRDLHKAVDARRQANRHPVWTPVLLFRARRLRRLVAREEAAR